MIHLTWTKSSMPLSKMIMWLFNEPCSHFAISFDDQFVFQSDLLGTEPTFWSWFKAKHTIVHELYISPKLNVDDAVWAKITGTFDRPKSYDFGAFLYFGLCGLAHKFFNRKMPKKNIWASSTSYLCTELAQVLSPIPGIVIPSDIDMITPEQLWLLQPPAEEKPAVFIITATKAP